MCCVSCSIFRTILICLVSHCSFWSLKLCDLSLFWLVNWLSRFMVELEQKSLYRLGWPKMWTAKSGKKNNDRAESIMNLRTGQKWSMRCLPGATDVVVPDLMSHVHVENLTLLGCLDVPTFCIVCVLHPSTFYYCNLTSFLTIRLRWSSSKPVVDLLWIQWAVVHNCLSCGFLTYFSRHRSN